LPYRRRRRSSSSTHSSSHSSYGQSPGTTEPGKSFFNWSRPVWSTRLAYRVIVFFLGVWVGAIVLMTVAVPRSFSSIDSVMANPPREAARMIQRLGPIQARALLRYQIAEANRLTYAAWGWIQLGLGLGLFLLSLFATRSRIVPLAISGIMAALAAVMNFVMIPRLATISRNLELQPTTTTVRDIDHFAFLNRGFSAYEAGIVMLGLVLLFFLFKRSEAGALASQHSHAESKTVEKA